MFEYSADLRRSRLVYVYQKFRMQGCNMKNFPAAPTKVEAQRNDDFCF